MVSHSLPGSIDTQDSLEDLLLPSLKLEELQRELHQLREQMRQDLRHELQEFRTDIRMKLPHVSAPAAPPAAPQTRAVRRTRTCGAGPPKVWLGRHAVSYSLAKEMRNEDDDEDIPVQPFLLKGRLGGAGVRAPDNKQRLLRMNSAPETPRSSHDAAMVVSADVEEDEEEDQLYRKPQVFRPSGASVAAPRMSESSNMRGKLDRMSSNLGKARLMKASSNISSSTLFSDTNTMQCTRTIGTEETRDSQDGIFLKSASAESLPEEEQGSGSESFSPVLPLADGDAMQGWQDESTDVYVKKKPLPTIHSAKFSVQHTVMELKPSSSFNVRSMCRKLIRHTYFDLASAACILLNAATMGWQADYTARRPRDPTPSVFAVLENCFAVVFTIELVLQLVVYQCRFFTRIGWKWNVLDFTVVATQLVETALLALKVGDDQRSSLSMLRTMRVLRLLRSIRVVRILKYLDDLRTVMVSVMSAFKPLCSTLLLLVLIIYITGIYFTELATFYRLDSPKAEADFAGNLDSLGATMLRLFQTVTGGMEWQHFSTPLIEHISPLMGIVFAAYITFMTLAILNIVTGVFVDAASQRSRKEKDVFMINSLRELFSKLDLNTNGVISWKEFELHLSDERLVAFFRDIDLDISEAQGLFMLLDSDNSGQINEDEFLAGCLNLRGPARALDMQLLKRELNEVMTAQQEQSHSENPYSRSQTQQSVTYESGRTDASARTSISQAAAAAAHAVAHRQEVPKARPSEGTYY